MKEIPHASVKQLAYKIKGTGKPSPRFAFLLGAGASRQSGIITAGEMIRFFKDQIVTECCPEDRKTDEEKEKWLKEQDWYNKDGSEYSKLFEKYEPKEIGRQRYIESIIEGKTTSFGYVVLANLMASNYVNTIITTNFDDLTYSACTSFTSIRPIVYAYGVLASEMRVTAPRAKILKLHGDYLYSAVKNTDREIATQDPNMARQVSQVLGEYGLVVVGYSGNDESVMNILSQISDKNDLYWCVRRDAEPNKRVKDLLDQKGGFLINIDGCDEMMNEIRGIVGFDVRAMIGSIQARQNSMIEQLKSLPQQYYASILPEVVDALKEQSQQQQDQIRQTEALDYFARAYKAHEEGDSRKAEELYRNVIGINPNDAVAHNNLGVALRKDPARVSEAETEYLKAIQLDPSLYIAYGNLSSLYQERRDYDAAISITLRLIEANPQLAYAHNGLGYSYLLKGDLPKAEEEFEKAARLDPRDYNLMLNVGLLRSLQGRASEARALWKEVLALCQGNATYDKLNRALYTFALGQTDQGLAEMQKVIQGDKPGVEELGSILQDAELIAKAPTPPPDIKKMLVLLRDAIAGDKQSK